MVDINEGIRNGGLNSQSRKEQMRSGSDEAEQDRDLDFHPIRIKGEPLSEIVIRERR